jgi:hypothetical protein
MMAYLTDSALQILGWIKPNGNFTEDFALAMIGNHDILSEYPRDETKQLFQTLKARGLINSRWPGDRFYTFQRPVSSCLHPDSQRLTSRFVDYSLLNLWKYYQAYQQGPISPSVLFFFQENKPDIDPALTMITPDTLSPIGKQLIRQFITDGFLQKHYDPSTIQALSVVL